MLTDNPYKVSEFDTMLKEDLGSPINRPETLTKILIKESGKFIHYQQADIVQACPTNQKSLNRDLRFKYKGLFKEPDRYVYSLTNGYILGNMGLVYVKKNRSFINESTKDWLVNLKLLPYLNAFSLPKEISLDGITLSLLTNGAEHGFYHFLFESMSKLKIYDSMLQHADHLLLNGPATAWKMKWISRTNIDQKKIIWIDNYSHHRCEQLIFTNRMVADQQVNQWCISGLREIFGIQATKSAEEENKLVWISRSGSVDRDLIWEEKILKYFPEITFIDLAKMDANETIDIIKSANYIIAPHGAGLSNVYIASAGTKILELYPKNRTYQPCYSRLSNVCGLDHKVLYLNFGNSEDINYGIDILVRTINEMK